MRIPRFFQTVGLIFVLPPLNLYGVLLFYGDDSRLYSSKDGVVGETIPLGAAVYADFPESIAVVGTEKREGLPIFFISKESGKITEEVLVPMPKRTGPLSTINPSQGLCISSDRKTFCFMLNDAANNFQLLRYVKGDASPQLFPIPKEMGAPRLSWLADGALLVIGLPNGGIMKFDQIDSSLKEVIPPGFLEEYIKRASKGVDRFSATYRIVPGAGIFIAERSAEGLKLRRLIDGGGVDENLSVRADRKGRFGGLKDMAVLSGPARQLIAVMADGEKIEFVDIAGKNAPVFVPIPAGYTVEQMTPFTVLRPGQFAIDMMQGGDEKLMVIDPLRPAAPIMISLPRGRNWNKIGISVLSP